MVHQWFRVKILSFTCRGHRQPLIPHPKKKRVNQSRHLPSPAFMLKTLERGRYIREPTCIPPWPVREAIEESERDGLKYHLKFHRSLIELSIEKLMGCLLFDVTANAWQGIIFSSSSPPIAARFAAQGMFAEGSGFGDRARGYPFDAPPKVPIPLIEFADTETSISNVFFPHFFLFGFWICQCHGPAANAFTICRCA